MYEGWLCVCVCVCVCVWVCTHVCVRETGGGVAVCVLVLTKKCVCVCVWSLLHTSASMREAEKSGMVCDGGQKKTDHANGERIGA